MSDFILREFTAEQKKLLGDIDFNMYQFHSTANTVCIAGGYMDAGREAKDVDFIIECRDDEAEFFTALISTLTKLGFESVNKDIFTSKPLGITIEATPKQYQDNTMHTNVGIVRVKHRAFGDLECQFIIRRADVRSVINNFPISMQQVYLLAGQTSATGMFDFTIKNRTILISKDCNPRYITKYKKYYKGWKFSKEI